MRATELSTPFDDIGKIKIGKRSWILGSAPLKKNYRARGICLTPKPGSDNPPMILVSTHLLPGSPKHMEAIIHETIHAVTPFTSERHCVEVAHAVMKALRGFGYTIGGRR